MTETVRRRVAWGLALGALATVGTWAVSTISGVTGDQMLAAFALVAVVAFGAIGALVAGRTGNALGWAMLAIVDMFAISTATETYATYAFTAKSPLPLATFAAWIGTLTLFLTLALLVTIPMLFPSGRPRWRWVWRTYLSATAVLIAGFAILPQEVSGFQGHGEPNPFAVQAWADVVGPILTVAGLSILACLLLSIVGLVLRFRGSQGDERQQIRWLAYVGVAVLVVFVANMVLGVTAGDDPSSPVVGAVSDGAFFVLLVLVLVGVPLACGIAILKYRLYDLDLVVKKTVVFALLAAFIALVYTAIVAGVGALVGSGSSTLLSFVAAAALAIAFQPVRDRARRFADRLVYGKRATPYEVLAEFSDRMAETYATDDVLPRMAQVLARGSGASDARVWLHVAGELRSEASSPPDAPGVPPLRIVSDTLPAFPEGTHAVEVRHQGDLLGALSVVMPADDPMTPGRERLVRDLAAQAGLVLRNVRLIGELRASRQRLVAAQDEERQKIERNIHDGVQQQLVALAVQLRLLEQAVDRDPDAAKATAAGLQEATTQAIDDLRDLARGIYPPLLADKGLPAALEAQVRRSPVPVHFDADGVGRYPREIESTVYFCALEALNNVAKYSEASSVRLELRSRRVSGTSPSASSTTAGDSITSETARTVPGCGEWPIDSTRWVAARGHQRARPRHDCLGERSAWAGDAGDAAPAPGSATPLGAGRLGTSRTRRSRRPRDDRGRRPTSGCRPTAPHSAARGAYSSSS